MVSVSVSSTNTCPPPKAAAYSASATDANALAEGMERGVVGDKGWWGIRGVGLYKAGGTDKGLFVSPTLSVTFWRWVKEVRWGVSKPNRAASHTARLRSGQECHKSCTT